MTEYVVGARGGQGRAWGAHMVSYRETTKSLDERVHPVRTGVVLEDRDELRMICRRATEGEF